MIPILSGIATSILGLCLLFLVTMNDDEIAKERRRIDDIEREIDRVNVQLREVRAARLIMYAQIRSVSEELRAVRKDVGP